MYLFEIIKGGYRIYLKSVKKRVVFLDVQKIFCELKFNTFIYNILNSIGWKTWSVAMVEIRNVYIEKIFGYYLLRAWYD